MNTRLSNPASSLTAELVALEPHHNAPLAALIRSVSAEYGLTADKGFSVADPNLDVLSVLYETDNAGCWKIRREMCWAERVLARLLAILMSASYRKCI